MTQQLRTTRVVGPARRHVRMTLVFLLLFGALPPSLLARGLPTAAIDAVVKRHFRSNGPGAIAAVIEDGRILHVATAGWADVERKVPFTTRTRVDLASVSKAFTAMAVLVLVDRGKLTLDDDVRGYLPELDRKLYRKPIPLFTLLGMTAGLPDYQDAFDDLRSVTNEDVARAVGALDPEFAPRSRYEYSNTAYSLLALIVKRTSGQPFPEFVKMAVFEPAGMRSTFVVDRPGVRVEQRAVGYKRSGSGFKPTRNDTSVVGDGQVFTSIDDMVQWERALRSGKLVTRKLLDRAFTSGTLKSGEATDYGFGWSVTGEGRDRTIEHDGGWNGTATFFRIRLGGKRSVVVFSNDEEADVISLADEIEEVISERE